MYLITIVKKNWVNTVTDETEISVIPDVEIVTDVNQKFLSFEKTIEYLKTELYLNKSCIDEFTNSTENEFKFWGSIDNFEVIILKIL